MSESFVVINGACQQFTYAGVVIDAIYKIILGVLFELFFGEPITFDDDLPYCTTSSYIQPLQLAMMESEESMYFDFESDASTFSYFFLLQGFFGVLAMVGISSAAYDYARRRD